MSDELPTVQRPRAQTGAVPAFVISVAEGPDRGKRRLFDLTRPSRVRVGPSPACDLVVSDREVSRRHAALELSDFELHLVDLGSTNGTFVSGLAIVDVVLQGGESLRLGGTTLG